MTQKDEKLQFLGLGSMVEIDHIDALADTLYLIVARAVGKDDDGKTILRYQVAPHPKGGSAKQSDDIITLDKSSITKVVHKGYYDEKDDVFLSDMIIRMENSIKNMSQNIRKEESIVQEKKLGKKEASISPKVEDEKELLNKDPFYKFR